MYQILMRQPEGTFFKVVSPSGGKGKSSFRKSWSVSTVVLEFWCGRRRTSIRKHPQTFPDAYGFSFHPKTTDLIIENTYFYYRKW